VCGIDLIPPKSCVPREGGGRPSAESLIRSNPWPKKICTVCSVLAAHGNKARHYFWLLTACVKYTGGSSVQMVQGAGGAAAGRRCSVQVVQEPFVVRPKALSGQSVIRDRIWPGAGCTVHYKKLIGYRTV
jgi:hypothetical protein